VAGERGEAGVGPLGFWLSWREAVDDQDGASLVEYALLLALIALVCVGAMQLLGGDVSTRLSTFSGSIAGS
jgi:pilus assembly protein Flp/PilA